MWPFKKTELARPDEFPAVIEALRDDLRIHFPAEADRLEKVLEGVWRTSNELYGELSIALRAVRRERRDFPVDIVAEVRRLIKSIDRICLWR